MVPNWHKWRSTLVIHSPYYSKPVYRGGFINLKRRETVFLIRWRGRMVDLGKWSWSKMPDFTSEGFMWNLSPLKVCNNHYNMCVCINIKSKLFSFSSISKHNNINTLNTDNLGTYGIIQSLNKFSLCSTVPFASWKYQKAHLYMRRNKHTMKSYSH